MSKARATQRPIAAARRGQIIQRVLVDGWPPARAAAVFGLEERVVQLWVRRYRRRGMESLREDPATADQLLRPVLRRIYAAVARLLGRPLFGRTKPAECVALRRTGDRRLR